MDFNGIDWNTMWQEELSHSQWKDNASQKELWDGRAGSFGKRINRVMDGEPRDDDDYVSKMLDGIEVEPNWTVLDIGCGPSTLTIPLAKKAGSVTGLDISPEMLKRVSYGLRNAEAYCRKMLLGFVPSRSCFHNIRQRAQ
jgi:2-polyprenyl-3-methyl-5-hydroxy-6-metoxy-1,4-benzoquinol methylase